MASLVLGVALFALIMMRGQQAEREGNQELRNDTYWVLVSPLVFSGFGLYLLRHPSGSRQRRSRAAAAALEQRLTQTQVRAEQQISSAQATLANAQAAATASQRDLEVPSGT